MAMTASTIRSSTKVNPLASPRRDELRFNESHTIELKQNLSQVHRKILENPLIPRRQRHYVVVNRCVIRLTTVGVDNRLAVARAQMSIRTGAASPIQKVFANRGFSLNVAIMIASRTSMPTQIAVKIEIRFANGETNIISSAPNVLVGDLVSVSAIVARVIPRHIEDNVARIPRPVGNGRC